MDKEKSAKAIWDNVSHTVYLDVCIEEVRANNRPGSFLNPLGYANLERKFNDRTKRGYSCKQLKNRWDALKKEYSTWKSFVQRASGLGRDPFTKTIDASDEWWEIEIKVSSLSNHLHVFLCFTFCVFMWYGAIDCRHVRTRPSFG